jgi:Leucine Rich repeat
MRDITNIRFNLPRFTFQVRLVCTCVGLLLVSLYGQDARTGDNPVDGGADMERALARFRQAGGVAQWVNENDGRLMNERSNSKHLMVRRFNGPENRPPLEKLGVLREVTTLTLHGIDFADEDLKQLAGWKHLRGLQLVYSRGITDAGLKYVAGMSDLQRLVLWDTQVTNKGMKDIATLAKLEYLEIQNSHVGDAGLTALERNKKLTTIKFSGTEVTPKGVDSLHRALPRCTVEAD